MNVTDTFLPRIQNENLKMNNSFYDIAKSQRPMQPIPGTTIYVKKPQRYPEPSDILEYQVGPPDFGVLHY